MIIAFSGLGGSGKTTQIRKISRHLGKNQLPLRVFALRDYFWWPRLAAKLPKKSREIVAGAKPSPKRREETRLKDALRFLFYFIDSWRIYFFVLRPGRELTIADRWFHDFFVELVFCSGRLGIMKKTFIKLLPRPTVNLLFKIDPEAAMKRKYEAPLALLKKQEEIYQRVFALSKHNLVEINAERDPEKVFKAVEFVVHIFLSSPKADFYSALLFALAVTGERRIFEEKALQIDYARLFRKAADNRMLWGCANLMGGLVPQEAVSLLERIKAEGRALLDKYRRTTQKIALLEKKTGIKTTLIKEDNEVELNSDVDIFIGNENDFKRFASASPRFRKTGEGKGEIIEQDALAIDIHRGVHYNGLLYVSPQFISAHPPEARVLTIISHSLIELTLLTLGDWLKIRSIYSKVDWPEVRQEAKSRGWLSGLNWWLGLYKKEDLMLQNSPLKLSVLKLATVRLRRGLMAFRVDLAARDFYNLARALRARRMGKVPFHENWSETLFSHIS